MKSIRLYDIIRTRVLVTRESARSVQSYLAAALADAEGEVGLDFSGVAGITPSFFDEILTIIEECIEAVGDSKLQVSMLRPPTLLSSKFEAVGRGHGVAIRESGEDAWIIYKKAMNLPADK